MPSPFPGMDPYLEHPELWPGVHNLLIAQLAMQLGRQLKPKYFVSLEERTYLADPGESLALVGRPDIGLRGEAPARPTSAEPAPSPGALIVQVPLPDEVRESYLEVRRARSREVVTVIELLSPSNKLVAGKGRERYEEKRAAVLGSRTHLLEVDLIRAGRPMTVYGTERSSAYRVLVSRSDQRPRAELFLFGVRDRLPQMRVPLRRGDEEPELDLRGALDVVYDSTGYEVELEYDAPAVPPLAADDASWADELLRAAGVRPRDAQA